MTDKTNVVTKTKEKQVKQTLDMALFNFMQENVVVPRNGIGEAQDGKKFSYAEIEDINSVVNPVLFKHGLMISSVVEDSKLVIQLIHPSTKEKKVSTLELGNPASSHEMGSRITHYRRYGISALLNLVLDKTISSTVIPEDAKTTKIPTAQPPVENNEQELSAPYKSAYNAIQATNSPEALEVIAGQIQRSTKLTDEEKKALIIVKQNHEHEISGTIH